MSTLAIIPILPSSPDFVPATIRLDKNWLVKSAGTGLDSHPVHHSLLGTIVDISILLFAYLHQVQGWSVFYLIFTLKLDINVSLVSIIQHLMMVVKSRIYYSVHTTSFMTVHGTLLNSLGVSFEAYWKLQLPFLVVLSSIYSTLDFDCEVTSSKSLFGLICHSSLNSKS